MASKQTRKRVDISEQHLQQLQALADYEGHGNISAALATLVKFGVPLYMSQRGVAPVAPVPTALAEQTQIESTPELSGIQAGSSLPVNPGKPTLAAQLGFRYTKDNSSPLVEAALADSSPGSYCVQQKPDYSVPTDASIAALAGLVDEF